MAYFAAGLLNGLEVKPLFSWYLCHVSKIGGSFQRGFRAPLKRLWVLVSSLYRLAMIPEIDWVAVQEFKLSYHSPETILFLKYLYYDNLSSLTAAQLEGPQAASQLLLR